MSIDWELAGAVVISGLVVVFAILLILVFLCQLLSKIVESTQRKNSDIKSNMDQKQPKKTHMKSSASVQKAVASPAVENGITGEIVSAISAAIACIMGEGRPFAIRSIKRVARGRNVWNAAGIAENTRPF